MYILRPHAAGILYPPLFIRPPPTPRTVFSCGGGVGVYKIRPRKKTIPQNPPKQNYRDLTSSGRLSSESGQQGPPHQATPTVN